MPRQGRLYDLGRFDEVEAVRKLASKVETAERNRGERDLKVKMKQMQDSLRARHQKEKQIAVGRNVMDTKTLSMEIDAGRDWIRSVTKIQTDNVLRRHRHAARIKESRCPDVGYARMVTLGRRYHKEYVSHSSNPIPSVSNEHHFQEPTRQEVAGQRMAKTRQRVAALMATKVDVGDTVEVNLDDQ